MINHHFEILLNKRTYNFPNQTERENIDIFIYKRN